METIVHVCEGLRPLGVELLVENLWPQSSVWLGSVSEILSLIGDLDLANLGLNLDLRALWEAGEGWDFLDARSFPHVRHVHLSDPGLSPPSLATHHGGGVERLFRDHGYSDWVALEVRRPQSSSSMSMRELMISMSEVSKRITAGVAR
jgi:sugar phosphate isomerase/epimerase